MIFARPEAGFHSRQTSLRGRFPFEAGVHSRQASIRGRRPFEAGVHSRLASIRGRLPFEAGFQIEEGFHSRQASIRGGRLFEAIRCMHDSATDGVRLVGARRTIFLKKLPVHIPRSFITPNICALMRITKRNEAENITKRNDFMRAVTPYP